MARIKTRDELIAEIEQRHPNQACWAGFGLGLLIGLAIAFGWGAFHFPQLWNLPSAAILRYKFPDAHVGNRHLPSAASVRYQLMIEGNEDHHLDPALLHFRMFPSGALDPRRWVFEHKAVPALYPDGNFLPLVFPLVALFASIFFGLIWGIALDRTFKRRALAGIRIDGARLLDDTAAYNKAIKGEGMRYYVTARKDR